MFKKKTVISLIAALLVVSFVTTATAQGNSPPVLSTGFMLQNRSQTDTASITITYYNESGNAVEADSDSIAAGASKAYYVPNVLSQPDGRYSVVVASSQSLFAMVNTVTASGASPNVEATHSGFTSDDIGSPLYLPWVTCDYYDYNSMVAIQNAGSGDTTITVEFFQSGQSTSTKTYTFNNVHAGGSVYLDMTAEPYNTDLNGFYGAVRIRSTGDTTPLAAVVMDTNPAGSILRSYNAVKSGSTDLVAPQVTANYYGFSDGMTLQNPDPSQTANVNIKFYRAGDTSPTVEYDTTVAPSSARPLYLPNILGMPTNFNGSALVHSNIPIMGIVNQVHDPTGPSISYNMVPVSDAAQTVYMPQVNRHFYGYEFGYQLYNVGPEQVQVSVVFSKPDGSIQTTINHAIPANSSVSYYLGDWRGDGLGDNYNGGAKATITSGNGGLIGIGSFVSPNGGDYKRTYNLFH